MDPGDPWCALAELGVPWWALLSLVGLGESWRLLSALVGPGGPRWALVWWALVSPGGSWWALVSLDGFWWVLVGLGVPW